MKVNNFNEFSFDFDYYNKYFKYVNMFFVKFIYQQKKSTIFKLVFDFLEIFATIRMTK